MNASELKMKVQETHTDSHFFDRKTMKFFGDTMKNYGCRMTVVKTRDGESLPVYELYRKNAVKHGLKTSAYFHRETFEQVMNVEKDYNN